MQASDIHQRAWRHGGLLDLAWRACREEDENWEDVCDGLAVLISSGWLTRKHKPSSQWTAKFCFLMRRRFREGDEDVIRRVAPWSYCDENPDAPLAEAFLAVAKTGKVAEAYALFERSVKLLTSE
jgi:hypothetical protein